MHKYTLNAILLFKRLKEICDFFTKLNFLPLSLFTSCMAHFKLNSKIQESTYSKALASMLFATIYKVCTHIVIAHISFYKLTKKT
jgi:hypothetical protein